mgnify:CR=1 FL=1
MQSPPFDGTLFGVLDNGSPVYSYQISDGIVSMTVITFGAIITSLRVPSHNGILDIVLGFDTLDDYIAAHGLPAPPYFGALVGRYAGRISGGQFMLGTALHKLPHNDNGNTLHGGTSGFDRALWNVTDKGENYIEMKHVSPDGDQGFPGELTVSVRYTIANQVVEIDIEATTTADCPVNLTQHSYFNLDGHDADIRNQLLKINSSRLLETDAQHIPTGNLLPPAEKQMDYSTGGHPYFGIDDDFVVNDTASVAAVLQSDVTGIRMEIMSNQPSLHVYVGGNLFGRFTGKAGAKYHHHSGIAFESQFFPDAPNRPAFPSTILKQGELYKHQTLWKFTTEP